MAEFTYREPFELGDDATQYRKLTADFVASAKFDGREILRVAPEALTLLASEAFRDISHLLRPGHLKQMRRILDDPEASANDKFVVYDLLKNACIAAGGVLPMCQDTGTAIVMGKKGEQVWTGANDAEALARGVHKTFTERNLRYSQVAPLTMFDEVNSGDNLPAQIDLYSTDGDTYEFLFVAKGGGSANKTFLYQESPSRLHREGLLKWLDEKIKTLGTAACPPYHLAIVVGGTSAEFNLKTLKLATCRYLDNLPASGNKFGQGFRDVEMEEKVHKLTQLNGIGAQFGGKYFCHDVRVIRLPRHGASLPISIGVSCAADRQALGRITRDGVFLEQLETNPAQYLPEIDVAKLGGPEIRIDLDRPMDEIRKTLSQHKVTTRISLSGPLIVARDLAHAKLRTLLESGTALPPYFKDHPIYYAGPAKRPEGYASGAFGPTTAGRMDGFIEQFMAAGGSYVTLAKGNRSKAVTDACKRYGGFYLCSIGGEGAKLAQDCIKKIECLAYPELGMEAIWRIEVEDFPAFIVVDDKGNDFFAKWTG
ncbi:MAG TPA: fumarate hydratase [Alphaproteobacteria bacterium]|nr:fumarate hydratase [Alphaproteobacteria bacterium]